VEESCNPKLNTHVQSVTLNEQFRLCGGIHFPEGSRWNGQKEGKCFSTAAYLRAK
jgi:hypothetical protein